MMLMRWMFTVLLLSASLIAQQSAREQQRDKQPLATAEMELRIQVAESLDGLPTVFVFELVNVSGHDIHLPQPTLGCVNVHDGEVALRVHFRPAKPSQAEGGGHGCIVDAAWEKGPLERAAKWKVLRPGESLRLIKTRAEMDPLNQTGLGYYEFWAEYNPPHVEPEHEAILRGANITFPHTRLCSRHLEFEKKQ